MNGRLFLDNFVDALAADITNSSTSITISDTSLISALPLRQPDGVRFGTFDYDDIGLFVVLTLEAESSGGTLAEVEIIYVFAAPDGTTLTVTRGEEGTTAKAWPAGTPVQARFTAGAAGSPIDYSGENEPIRVTLAPSKGNVPATIPGSASASDINNTNQVNVTPGLGGVYGDDSVNIGNGGAGDGAPSETSNSRSRNAVNIGGGGIYSLGGSGVDRITPENSISVGGGGAGGQDSINFGSGGAEWGSINIGNFGAFPNSQEQAAASISIGNEGGAFADKAINIGSIGTGAFGTVVIGNPRFPSDSLNASAEETITIGRNGDSDIGRANTNVGIGGLYGTGLSYSVNVGAGGVYTVNDDDERAVNIGAGGAWGSFTINIGGAGAQGPYAINIGDEGGGAYTQDTIAIGSHSNGANYVGAISVGHDSDKNGDEGAGSPGAVALGYDAKAGDSTTGQDSEIAIGNNASAVGVTGIAIGKSAQAGFSQSVALGAATQATQADQVHGGDRNFELGSATSVRGVHLYSPDGTRYLLTVANGGTLDIVADPI